MPRSKRARRTDVTDLDKDFAALPGVPEAWRTPEPPAGLEPPDVDRVVAIARDARSVHVQWTVTADSVRRARASLDGPARFVLRIYVVDGAETSLRTIRVSEWIGGHTVTVRQPGARVVAAVGFESADAFAHVARASAVRLPRTAKTRFTMARARPGTRFVDVAEVAPASGAESSDRATPTDAPATDGVFSWVVRVSLPPVPLDDPRVDTLVAQLLRAPLDGIAVAVSPIALDLLAARAPHALARLLTAGELLTTPATDAFFPLLDHDRPSMAAQLAVAVRTHERHLGAKPAGILFSDGGYESRTDELLTAAGLSYAIVDADAVRCASATPERDIYAALSCPGSGLRVFGRDPEARRLAVGDLPPRPVLPDPGYVAAVRTAFAGARATQLAAIRKRVEGTPLVVCELALDELPVVAGLPRMTPSTWLEANAELQSAWPGPSRAGGLLTAMCADERSWLLRRLHAASTRVDALIAAEDPRAAGAARELMLAQCGDWMRGVTAGDPEALDRILEHLRRVADPPERPWLSDVTPADFKVAPPRRVAQAPTDREVDRHRLPRPNEIW